MKYYVVGAMAGSSMDGLDLTLVSFTLTNGFWTYEIIGSSTVSYNEHLHEQLRDSPTKSQSEKNDLDHLFGEWIGDQINLFLTQYGNTKVDLLAVHGHTVMHAPHEGISWQLGSGQRIAEKTNIASVTDFRTADISEGGQGAPLVPMGDFVLFKEYDACLNLGGIANVSIRDKEMAWDICPCNQVLNFYANKLGFEYDKEGDLARGGVVSNELLEQIFQIDYFSKEGPKSLPNGFIPHHLLDTVDPSDGLRSYVEFIALQISKDLSFIKKESPKLLITGGGAFNSFLIERTRHYLSDWMVEIPNQELISFKEALIFAFLGLKRFRGEVNVQSSVTGASKDTSSGVIHFPK